MTQDSRSNSEAPRGADRRRLALALAKYVYENGTLCAVQHRELARYYGAPARSTVDALMAEDRTADAITHALAGATATYSDGTFTFTPAAR